MLFGQGHDGRLFVVLLMFLLLVWWEIGNKGLQERWYSVVLEDFLGGGIPVEVTRLGRLG